jgi:methylmalonyl-CoA/ethylmalonyl-CoA epimerase
MLTKIEHVALAVADLEAAIRLYKDVWGLPLEHRETVEEQGVEEAMFRLGDSYLQLMAPLGPDTVIGKFIEKRGEGLHHIAYEVDDIESALAELKKTGAHLIDETPRPGSRNTRVAFVHPKENRGVLVELVEKAG